MKPPIPTTEPIPVQTLRRYGLNATADEVAEVYRQHGELAGMLGIFLRAYRCDDHCAEIADEGKKCIHKLGTELFTTATQKKG